MDSLRETYQTINMNSPERRRSSGRGRQSIESHKSAKVLLLGLPGVGKSAIAVRFLTKRYIGEYDEDLEIAKKNSKFRNMFLNYLFNDTKPRYIESKETIATVIDDELVSMEIFDTCTKQEDGCVDEEHIRWADGYMLVYDVTKRASFSACADIRQQVLELRKASHVPMVLVGNKTDIMHLRQVTREEGKELASTLGCAFTELSASEDYQKVNESFSLVYREIKSLRAKGRTTLFGRIFGMNKKGH